MGLLLDAAAAWSGLYNTTYDLLLGRRETWTASLSLGFAPEDFPHLAGMQYAGDIDFGLSRAEIYGGKLVGKLLAYTHPKYKLPQG